MDPPRSEGMGHFLVSFSSGSMHGSTLSPMKLTFS